MIRSPIRTWGLALATAALAACASVDTNTGAAPHVDFAIVGVDLVPMTDPQSILRDRTVLVGDGRILKIAPSDEARVPAGALRIPGTGRYLMPGLADMHVHLEHLEDPDLLKLFVGHGVTTVRSMDGRPYMLDWRMRVTRGELVGPRIVTAGPIIDGDPPLRDDNLAVAGAASAERAVRDQHRAGYDFVKVYTNLSPEAFRAAATTARSLGMPVAGHVPRRTDLDEAMALMDSIEHLTDFGDMLGARPAGEARRWHWSNLLLAQPLDKRRIGDLARDLVASRTWTVPTLVEAERRVGSAAELDRWRRLPEMALIPADALDHWVEQVREAGKRLDGDDWHFVESGRRNRRTLVAGLHRGGAWLLAGTDTPNAFVVPGAALHDELALMVEAGLTPGEALMTATRNAARFMGEEELWGTVQIGRRADLVLLSANPLDNIANSRRIVGVMASGRWWSGDQLGSLTLIGGKHP